MAFRGKVFGAMVIPQRVFLGREGAFMPGRIK
jgi:hypothetical protein